MSCTNCDNTNDAFSGNWNQINDGIELEPIVIKRPSYRTDVTVPTTVFDVGFDLPSDVNLIDVIWNGQEIYTDQTEVTWSVTGTREITLSSAIGTGGTLNPDFLTVKKLVIE